MKFNSIVQGELPIHQFIIKLQTQADVCEYGAMKDEQVRDIIVVGVSDKRLWDYLIDLEDLNLQRCIQKAKQFLSHHEQSKQVASGSSASGESNLDVVKLQNNRSGRSNFRPSENKQTEKSYGKTACFVNMVLITGITAQPGMRCAICAKSEVIGPNQEHANERRRSRLTR